VIRDPRGVNGITPGPEGLTFMSTPTTDEGAKGSPRKVHGTLGPEG